MADERVIVKILSVVVAFKMSMVIMIVGGIKAPKVCNSGILLWPMIAIGLFLVVTCMFGCCGVSEDGIFICFLAGVLIAMLSLVVFVLFAFIAVGGIDAGQVKLQEYKLEDYRGWLRARVADPHYWATTVACLRRRDVCELSSDPNLAEKYNNDNYVISPIEYGCCKPPSSCAFTYMNDTTWAPKTGEADLGGNVVDCSRWSNDPQKLCFECDSCKAGFLDDTRKKWTKAAPAPIGALVVLVVFLGPCIIACAILLCNLKRAA